MPDPTTIRLFSPDLEARFVHRPNRFILEAETKSGLIRAHCPNPGRMEEFLLPGRTLIFESAPSKPRKTSWSLAGIRYRNHCIPLNSGRANAAAEHLVLPELFPGAKIRPEVADGPSRFDFLVSDSGIDTWVEVKSCTLVEHGTAMFPDAPTERGRRHIEHLAELTERKDTRAMVLFVILNPEAERFVPNFHTDPAFALTLRRVSERVQVKAVSLETGEDGLARLGNLDVPVDLSVLEAAEADAGVYALVLEISEDTIITVGSLGAIGFKAGWYVYVGSGKKNLSKRIARHLRVRKQVRWHIDYLAAAAAKKKAYPIYTLRDLECPLAADMAVAADGSVPGFGSSDCNCSSHLFYFRHYPVRTEAFQEVMLRYRHRESIRDQVSV